ncbi:MAG: stage V sporulation protein AC [Thermaerobacter sp.]|nr:stage V sporulation protein AC [Bacillota bacterium]
MRADAAASRDYAGRLRRHQPRPPILRNVLAAFLVGGLICVVGQAVLGWFMSGGMTPKDAAAPTAAVMVIAGALLTGLGLYDELARFAGMGSALPITGFANSIVAPALEAKREGYVLGVGAQLFTIAGPVIVYGVLAALAAAALRYGLVGP